MVHAIDLNFRVPTSMSVPGSRDTNLQLSDINQAHTVSLVTTNTVSIPTIVDGISTDLASRLNISNASKLTLQIMLGTMTLLGTGAYSLADIRGTLPRNPLPIASSIVFFVGSDICGQEAIPRGAGFMKKTQLDRIFQGRVFGLGWWRVREEEPSQRLDGNGEETIDGLGGGGGSGTVIERERATFGIDEGVPEVLEFSTTKGWGRMKLWGRGKEKG